MDRYKASNDLADLRRSRNLYAEAFEKSPDDYYTGINAASKSIFLGEMEKGYDYTQRGKIVGNKAIPGDYWKTATIAEVLLIQKKYQKASEMYRKAIDIAPSEKDSHGSTAKQAKLLLEKLGVTEESRLKF